MWAKHCKIAKHHNIKISFCFLLFLSNFVANFLFICGVYQQSLYSLLCPPNFSQRWPKLGTELSDWNGFPPSWGLWQLPKMLNMFAEGSEVRAVNCYIVIGVCTASPSSPVSSPSSPLTSSWSVSPPSPPLSFPPQSKEVLLTSKRVTRAQPMSPSPYRLTETL